MSNNLCARIDPIFGYIRIKLCEGTDLTKDGYRCHETKELLEFDDQRLGIKIGKQCPVKNTEK